MVVYIIVNRNFTDNYSPQCIMNKNTKQYTIIISRLELAELFGINWQLIKLYHRIKLHTNEMESCKQNFKAKKDKQRQGTDTICTNILP